ncbi:MAG: ATP-binding cassette domain-containing protein [Gloeomargaritaceae cyanobacterium C42_A2020_066]|nr:ATP-binding cassette domain-containing protein [Gloeomargaritaceae cyanobacterium C42_A2020_066]
MVLARCEFGLKAGTLLGVRGPSGCGKTLLLRAIAGLDPVQAGDLCVSAAGRVSGDCC